MSLGVIIIVWLLLATIAALSVALVYYVNRLIEQNDVIIYELRTNNKLMTRITNPVNGEGLSGFSGQRDESELASLTASEQLS